MTARTVWLTLLSHGATTSTRAAAFPTDEPLDERAVGFLPQLAERLDRADIVRTSPALQARQTASGLNLEPVVDPLLRGWDHGRWAGMTIREVGEREPDALSVWRRDPASRVHGGESLDDLLVRVGGWFDGQTGSGPRTLAVTHACVIRAALVRALKAGPTTFWHLDVGPLTAVALSFAAGRWTLKSMKPL